MRGSIRVFQLSDEKLFAIRRPTINALCFDAKVLRVCFQIIERANKNGKCYGAAFRWRDRICEIRDDFAVRRNAQRKCCLESRQPLGQVTNDLVSNIESGNAVVPRQAWPLDPEDNSPSDFFILPLLCGSQCSQKPENKTGNK